MFRKLLRYDMRAIVKYWWIAAAVSLLFSAIGGVCIQILKVDYTEMGFLQGVAILGLVLVALAIGAFSLVNMILVFARFYKNFFTDEGYLTFTLPVRRSQLLNSKLLASLIFMVCTGFVMMADIAVLLLVGIPEEIFSKAFIRGIKLFIEEVSSTLGFYAVVYILEILAAIVVSSIFAILVIFVCITLASTLTKKHKFIVAIGLYYAYSSVMGFVMQLFMLNTGIYSIVEKIAALSEGELKFIISIILLGGISLMGVGAAGLHVLEEYLLRRRLNLD